MSGTKPSEGNGDLLARLGDAFADPTRRLLYDLVARAPEPLCAAVAGELAGVHRTVARGHLERLVGAGILRTELLRDGGGGRPAKLYRVCDEPLSVSLPARRFELLATLLADAVASLAADEGEAARAASSVGWAYGRAVGDDLTRADGGATTSGRRLAAVAWLDEGGWAPTLEEEPPVLCLGVCVFRERAAARPALVCALDRGLIAGLLGVAEGALHPLGAVAAGERCCRLQLPA